MRRTLNVINRGGRIVLKRGCWYMHHHTNIAAGSDAAVWGQRGVALEFDTLELAFLLAPIFGAAVVAVYPKKVSP